MQKYYEYDGLEFKREELKAALIPLLKNKDYGFSIFAFVENEIVGYSTVCFGYSIEFKGKDAFLDEIFVHEKFRNKGIGKKLLQRTEEEAIKRGVKALHLQVEHHNEKAKKLYEEVGYKNQPRFTLTKWLKIVN